MSKGSDLRWQRSVGWLALSVAFGTPVSALGQYKVVGPKGSVSYTDRPPARTPGTVEQLEVPATTVSQVTPNAALPLELRQVAGRYPVILYTTAKDCEGCEAGRQYLRQRGIPFNEKQVNDGDGRGARTGYRVASDAFVDDRQPGAAWVCCRSVGFLPRRGRLPQTIASAGILCRTGANAAGRQPCRRLRQHQPPPRHHHLRSHRHPHRAAFASESVLQFTACSRCGRQRPAPAPSARTGWQRQARRPARRTTRASGCSTG